MRSSRASSGSHWRPSGTTESCCTRSISAVSAAPFRSSAGRPARRFCILVQFLADVPIKVVAVAIDKRGLTQRDASPGYRTLSASRMARTGCGSSCASSGGTKRSRTRRVRRMAQRRVPISKRPVRRMRRQDRAPARDAFDNVICDTKTNAEGLQLADLMGATRPAYPAARSPEPRVRRRSQGIYSSGRRGSRTETA